MTQPADHNPVVDLRAGDSDGLDEDNPNPEIVQVVIFLAILFCLPLALLAFYAVPLLVFILAVPTFVLCVSWVVMSMTIGYQYLQRLRTLGYSWAEISDANIILIKCGRTAYYLPPAVDYEILPGSQNNYKGIVKFLKELARYKRKARRRRMRQNKT